MQNVPKIIVQRLRAPSERVHPDADLLTAFAEQSLPEAERAEVLKHLARCGDCREVIVLALPAGEADALPTFVTARHGGWLSWPGLRWGVVAAGVLLVTSVGVLQYRQRHQPNVALVAKVTPPERTLDKALKVAPLPQPALAPVAPAPTQTAKQEVRKKGAPRVSDALSAKQLSPAASGISRQQPLDRPSSTETVEVESDGTQINTPGETQDRLTENQSDQVSQTRSFAKFDGVGKAKNPVPAPAASGASPAFAPAAVPFQTSPALMLRTSPRWTISSAGGLQRSFDAGKTWENVNVPASPVTSSQMQVAADNRVQNDQNNSNKYQKGLKQTAQPNSTPIFRAVAAIGPEVWAGGSAAMLYHSADFGAHWSPVLPAAGGAALSGDIIAIEFFDPQRGKITTSTAEVWITADAGQTWDRRP